MFEEVENIKMRRRNFWEILYNGTLAGINSLIVIVSFLKISNVLFYLSIVNGRIGKK